MELDRLQHANSIQAKPVTNIHHILLQQKLAMHQENSTVS